MAIKVVAYYRMSTEDQTESIQQQKQEVKHFASRNNMEIVQEYADEGKSGSKDTEKRTNFVRMLNDVTKPNQEIVGILCYSTSRFARLDSVEVAPIVAKLRTAKIKLFTTKEGAFDWDTMTGRIQSCVMSELNNLYCQGLAEDSLRGRRDRLKEGNWVNGSVPFGYDRLYIAPDGETRLVKRTEAFRKPHGWRLNLQINQAEAETITFIFQRFTETDTSMRQIAMQLTENHVPSPQKIGTTGTGNLWNTVMIKQILTNPAYIGTGFLALPGRGGKKVKYRTSNNLQQPNVCPIIIEPKVWEQAQQRATERKRTKRQATKGAGALSGVVFCAMCQHRMAATHWQGRIAYVCNSPSLRPGKFDCNAWRIYQDELQPQICSKLVEIVDGKILERLASRPELEKRDSQLVNTERAIQQKQRQLETALDNFLSASADLRPLLEGRLQTMRDELAKLEREQGILASQDKHLSDFTKWWTEIRPSLIKVRDAQFADGTPINPTTVHAKGTENNHHSTLGLGRDENGNIYLFDADRNRIEPATQEVLMTAERLRSLLLQWGIRVIVSFKEGSQKTGKGNGRGKGRKWQIDKVVMESVEHEIGVSVEHHTLIRAWLSQAVTL